MSCERPQFLRCSPKRHRRLGILLFYESISLITNFKARSGQPAEPLDSFCSFDRLLFPIFSYLHARNCPNTRFCSGAVARSCPPCSFPSNGVQRRAFPFSTQQPLSHHPLALFRSISLLPSHMSPPLLQLPQHPTTGASYLPHTARRSRI